MGAHTSKRLTAQAQRLQAQAVLAMEKAGKLTLPIIVQAEKGPRKKKKTTDLAQSIVAAAVVLLLFLILILLVASFVLIGPGSKTQKAPHRILKEHRYVAGCKGIR